MTGLIVLIATLAVIVALLLFGLLLMRLAEAHERAMNVAGGQAMIVAKRLLEITEWAAPVRKVRCRYCGGEGEVELENPLIAALAKAVEANAKKAKR